LQEELERLRRENAELKKQLKGNKDWFFEIFNTSPSLISITRIKDGKILDLNNASASLGGFTREDLNDTSTIEIERGLWADTKQRDEIARKIREEGSVSNFEAEFIDKNREIRHVLLSANPIAFDGEACILSVAVDITERKKMEDALRESEERFNLITNTIDEIFYIYDAEKGVAIYLSPAFERIWGYSRERAVNSEVPFLNPVHPEDREKVMQWGPLLSSGKSVNYEYRIIREDGSVRHIWDRGYPITEKDGKVKFYVGTGRDVTEWRQAEEALRESREYLNQIINRISDTILVKDQNHMFVLVNDAFCAFAKRKREDLIGTGSFKGLPEELARSLLRDEERVLETGVESQTEDVITDRDGQQHILMTKKSIFTDKNGNRQLILVSRDITEYKSLEAQFLQSQKMEAIGVLAGGVAHDFNNLLNVINGYSEMALDELAKDHPVREDIEQILEAGQRAASLTSQLLAFGRKQILQPEVLDLRKIIMQMGSMLRRLIGEDIDLVTRTPKSLGTVLADPAKIQQVILNLAVNARDAMPQGGKLTIEVADVDFDEKFVKTHPMSKQGPHVMLAISDSGVGMDAKTQSRMFEPFFTTKEKGKGTGLGLATVYGIVNQSNGFIWVYSECGKGTTIKIYFPQAEPVRKKTASGTQPKLEFQGSETVLLVEDESAVRTLAGRILREKGYRVIEAADGKEALRLAEGYPDEIHLVLTDVVMPEMGGSILVSHIKESRPGIKALYISGYTDNAIVHHGILDSNIAFLEKPFSIDNLSRKVREVLDS
jgi:two-component system, cell cycle sensor histidine kinase and response regulator CckA